jgi:glycosyltransferase involved in cell wall biosynthesis
MVVAAALAMGIPVIGGPHSSGTSWAFARSRAGLLVNVASPTSIAQGMHTMPQDADPRSALARPRSESALNKYRLETVARKCECELGKARQEEAR